MATLFQINSGIVGSTGNIMLTLDRYARAAGFNTYMASVKNHSSKQDYPSNHFEIGTIIEKHFHRRVAAITGDEGSYSFFATKRLLKRIDEIQPDVIHLHNLHWCYINLGLLFDYLKRHDNIKVVWTLHDCWSFTGHCAYYDLVGCDKWQKECHDCPSYRQYPKSYFDNSKKIYKRKKAWFLGVKNMVLVTPSKWLNGEVKKSFLRDYQTRIISNGISLDDFYYIESDFRERNRISKDCCVILGIAYTWGDRKGFGDFLKLADQLPDTCKIVMVGGFSEEQIKACAQRGIIIKGRTASKREVAELYSASDIFFNPTMEEMFGLVNIEAQACGTPVITYRSGGSPECIGPHGGYIIEKRDIGAAVEIIQGILSRGKKYERSAVRSWTENFSNEETYIKYIDLYKELLTAER